MQTEIIKVRTQSEQQAAICRAVEMLAEGKVVAFPTETVYGVGARADITAGWDKLTFVKQRPENKPFTSHVGDKNEIFRLVPHLSAKHQLFIKKSLPGPLTIVFDLNDRQIETIKNNIPPELFNRLYFDNSIGIRLPDDKLAIELLTRAGGPVVASSANPAGLAPAYNSAMANKYLDGQIELIIDNGPARIQKPSTVVKISNSNFEIIREGIIDNRMIEKNLTLNILFVCTGNTCRSPMAEGFGRSTFAKKLDCGIDQLKENGYYISSAGVMATDGTQASQESVKACKAFGVDISGHRSRLLTRSMIGIADYILVMSERHYDSVVSMVPEAADKTKLLTESGVADPFCQSQEVYDRCAGQIRVAVENFVNRLGLV